MRLDFGSRLHQVESQSRARANKDEIGLVLRRQKAALRACLNSCFSLLESYLNGLAWRFFRTNPEGLAGLSQNELNLIGGDGTLRKKLTEYPRIISGRALWDGEEPDFNALLDLLKPYRDSLAHASPFSAPERFGGYDKLSKVYDLKHETVEHAVLCTLLIIYRLFRHIEGEDALEPAWLEPLRSITRTSFT